MKCKSNDCENELIGRQKNFCSDRCRKRTIRAAVIKVKSDRSTRTQRDLDKLGQKSDTQLQPEQSKTNSVSPASRLTTLLAPGEISERLEPRNAAAVIRRPDKFEGHAIYYETMEESMDKCSEPHDENEPNSGGPRILTADEKNLQKIVYGQQDNTESGEARDAIVTHLLESNPDLAVPSLVHYAQHPEMYAPRANPDNLNWGDHMSYDELAMAGFKANRVPIPGDFDYEGVAV